MRTRNLAATLLGLSLALALIASAENPSTPERGSRDTKLTFQPPEWDSGKGDLPSREQVAARIKYWVGQIADAKDTETIVAAGEKLAKDIEHWKAPAFRLGYAGEAGKQVVRLLKKAAADDALRQVRLVNAAKALADFKQISIQPALEELIVFRNERVRYLGWKAYRTIRSLCMKQGLDAAETMYASLEARAAKEDSGVVFGAIFKMMTLPGERPLEINAEAWANGQKQILETLKARWPRCCQQVLADQAEWMSSAPKGAEAVFRLAKAQGTDKKALAGPLQMLMDMTWSAGKAYDQAAEGSREESSLVTLLLVCERQMVLLVRPGQTPIEDALRAARRKPKEHRDTQVRLAVIKWYDELLVEHGVVKPDIPKPSAAGDEKSESAGGQPGAGDEATGNDKEASSSP